jgi:hypothetical protein
MNWFVDKIFKILQQSHFCAIRGLPIKESNKLGWMQYFVVQLLLRRRRRTRVARRARSSTSAQPLVSQPAISRTPFVREFASRPAANAKMAMPATSRESAFPNAIVRHNMVENFD